MRKAAAIFSILMGLSMVGTWTYMLLFKEFPEIRTLPLQAGYLLVAEGLTAAALIVSGYGVLSGRRWAPALILVALGELLYCAVRFAGELGQGGSPAGLVFFTLVAAGSLLFGAYLVLAAGGQRSVA